MSSTLQDPAESSMPALLQQMFAPDAPVIDQNDSQPARPCRYSAKALLSRWPPSEKPDDLPLIEGITTAEYLAPASITGFDHRQVRAQRATAG